MRIAMVSPYCWTVPGGVNNIVVDMVTHLEALGHEVWTIAPAGTVTRPAKNLPSNFVVAGRTFPVPSNGSLAHVSIWPFMIRKMQQLLSQHDFDLLHVHEPATPAVGAAAVLASKVPVVGTFHAAGDAKDYYYRWAPLADRILTCLSVRVAVSEAARECVATHFPGEYRIIPNGIDEKPYARARNGRRAKGRILFIGRPEPRKGLNVLVEAFAGLRKRMPEATLTLVGTDSEQLRTLVSRERNGRTDLLEGIHPLGRLSQEAKIEQMSKAEIMCAPSLGGESFGIILTEAMAAGLPVVASDIPGYRAVLAEGTNGVLVPKGDAHALENALFSTLSDPELRQRLSEDGVKRARRYSWDTVMTQVEAAYTDAVRVGPCEAEGVKVPVAKQAVHFMRMLSPNAKKPQTARQHATG